MRGKHFLIEEKSLPLLSGGPGGLEVDLIIQARGRFWPVEIKLTSTPSLNHVKSINRFKGLAGDEAGDMGVLVCNIEKKENLPGNNMAIPWFSFSEWVSALIDEP